MLRSHCTYSHLVVILQSRSDLEPGQTICLRTNRPTILYCYGVRNITASQPTLRRTPISWPGQGATDSPFAWALISSFLIRLYKKTAKGCKLQDPTGFITWKRAIDSFVDDAYLFHGILRTTSAIALMGMITHDIKRWTKILWTSGGAINSIKSFYSMLIWKFEDNGIATLCKNEELPANSVKIPNPSKPTETYTIKRKCVTEASKTLGVFKAADLSQSGELKYLKKKATKFAKALISCPLSNMHAWLWLVSLLCVIELEARNYLSGNCGHVC